MRHLYAQTLNIQSQMVCYKLGYQRTIPNKIYKSCSSYKIYTKIIRNSVKVHILVPPELITHVIENLGRRNQTVSCQYLYTEDAYIYFQ